MELLTNEEEDNLDEQVGARLRRPEITKSISTPAQISRMTVSENR